ncbi:MAG: protein kinase [Deltaproteobacteria bacterium]|nr:protein kinase [Deltaproteobacteria bacterium]
MAEFEGNTRYHVRRRLGHGGMGVVYHVWDAERRMDVALKVLSSLSPESIYKLKAEFRSLADTSHPNLVGLYDLVAAEPAWFFTMELVEGVDFMTWLQGESADGDAQLTPTQFSVELLPVAAADETLDAIVPDLTGKMPEMRRVGKGLRAPRFDPMRLRAAMRQLVLGVQAIHAAGKLHRDIKPSNVLVAATGRLVMLDFGLASDASPHEGDNGLHGAISGTPAYMSPEQSVGKPIGPASDWYSVGVMLYEALTGHLPFEQDRWLQMVQAKQEGQAVHPLRWNPTAPQDLADLAIRLLHPEPAQRPEGTSLLRAMGVRPESSEVAALDGPGEKFVGRPDCLNALDKALDRVRGGQVVALHLRGAAGLGKTALFEEFVRRQRSEGVELGLLEGRCHEREALPYKAFDALIDNLTRQLLALSPANLAALQPAEWAVLSHIFPVLLRVPAVATAMEGRPAASTDNRTVRRRAFAALRYLLTALAKQRPWVLFFDDLQWVDLDSVDLLEALLEPPDAPPVLLVLSYRNDDQSPSPALLALRKLGPERSGPPGSDAIDLEPLTHQECKALAAQMLGDIANAEQRAELVAADANGSPLYVVELVRNRDDRIAQGAASTTSMQVSLEQLIRNRVSKLPEESQKLLHTVAIAGRPVAQGVAVAAAGLGSNARQALLRLRSAKMLRGTGDSDRDRIEPYHNRVREVVLQVLPPEQHVRLHRSLAVAMEEQTADALAGAEAAVRAGLPVPMGADIDALAYHWLQAGDESKALHYAVLAGRKALDLHANHDALRHFETVLRILAARMAKADRPAEEQARDKQLMAEIEEQAGEAARQVGLYERARQLLQRGLMRATSATAKADVHVSVGRVLQEQGNTDGAIEELETALRLYGQNPPSNLAILGVQVAREYLLHLYWSTFGRERPVVADPALQKRADVMFALIRMYYFIDVARVAWAGMHAVNLARRLPRDGDRALAWSFYGVLLFGLGMLSRSARWCEEAVDLARRARDPVAEGVASMRLGTAIMFQNDLARAERLLSGAIRIYRVVGEMWELQTTVMLLATSHFMRGELVQALRHYEDLGKTGEEINSLMHQGWAKTWIPVCQWMLGQADEASTLTSHERALELSARARDLANTVATLMHMTTVAVREGHVERSAGMAVRTHEAVSRYLVGVPFLQAAWVTAAEAALFALENEARSVRRSTLLRIARQSCGRARLVAKVFPYLRGPALRVTARLAALEGRPKAADKLFRQAIDLLERSPNRWETGVAYYDASRALPQRRKHFAAEARRIFESLTMVSELRRMDRDPAE